MVHLSFNPTLAEDVTAGGFVFRIVINWWELVILVVLVTIAIYLFRRRRKPPIKL
jgi:hypothetical protein